MFVNEQPQTSGDVTCWNSSEICDLASPPARRRAKREGEEKKKEGGKEKKKKRAPAPHSYSSPSSSSPTSSLVRRAPLPLLSLPPSRRLLVKVGVRRRGEEGWWVGRGRREIKCKVYTVESPFMSLHLPSRLIGWNGSSAAFLGGGGAGEGSSSGHVTPPPREAKWGRTVLGIGNLRSFYSFFCSKFNRLRFLFVCLFFCVRASAMCSSSARLGSARLTKGLAKILDSFSLDYD